MIVERGGFDAIIGNPPFLGGKKVSGALGFQCARLVRQCPRGGREGQRRPGGLLLPARASLVICARDRWGSSRPTPSPKATPARSDLTGWWTLDSPLRVPSKAGLGRSSTANLEYAAVWGSVARSPTTCRESVMTCPYDELRRFSNLADAVEGQPGAAR